MEINTLHAHVSRAARDCDGPVYDSYVIGVTDDERRESAAHNGINDFTEIDFRERVVRSVMSVYACEDGVLHVKSYGVRWHETTDEGYRSAEVYWCDDESCDLGERHYRDVFAEQMGY